MQSMAQRVSIESADQYIGKEVMIRGWLYNRRSSGKILFLQVRDGTNTIQAVVVKSEVAPELFEQATAVTQESSLELVGTIREDKRSPLGCEIGVSSFRIIQLAEEYPISKKEHGVAFLMDHRHLWLRSSRQHAILRIRSELIQGIRDFFHKRGFMNVDAPIFTPSACEGTTTLFETDYFGDKAYLTQSGQLYNEAAIMALGKVYCFGPTFRAEKSKTRRHLTEFWMVEPEAAFMELDENMDLAEDFVSELVGRILSERKRELEVLERDTTKLEAIQKPFPRISYDEAVKILKDAGRDFEWGGDFGAEDETTISQKFDKPVLIHRYPLACKAFYMKADPDNEKVALCVDMIAPEGYGEIIGGGQREDDHDTLLGKIKAHELPPEAFHWYLDLRKYGSVPHSGFGLGVERTLAWICGIHHVRETIPFPRMLEKIVL